MVMWSSRQPDRWPYFGQPEAPVRCWRGRHGRARITPITERLEDVWVTRDDYPVLLEVARRIDRGEDLPTIEAVAESTGLPVDQVSLAAKALDRRGYVHTLQSAGRPWGFDDVSSDVYPMVGLHTDTRNTLDALVQLLNDAANDQDDQEERSRLRRVAEALGSVSRGVMQGVLTAYLTGQLPGH
jgi:hypothetical protein